MKLTTKLSKDNISSLNYIQDELKTIYKSLESIQYEVRTVQQAMEETKEGSYDDFLELVQELKNKLVNVTQTNSDLFVYATYLRRDY